MNPELATRYHKALLAGQEEVKDYKTWFENYRKTPYNQKQSCSIGILGGYVIDYNDDTVEEEEEEEQEEETNTVEKDDAVEEEEEEEEEEEYIDHYENYMYFLLDALTVRDDIYEYKMVDWVADWWRKFKPDSVYRCNYNWFWEDIWVNPKSAFLFANRLHINMMMHWGVMRFEKPIECQYHLGDIIPIVVDMVKNEGGNTHIDWEFAVCNTHPTVIKLVEDFFEKGFVDGKFTNSDVNYNEIYSHLCKYSHHIHLIEKYQFLLFDEENKEQEESWYSLCSNKNAIPILEKHRDKWIHDTTNLCSIVTHPELMYLVEHLLEKGFKEHEDWVAELCAYEHALLYIPPYLEYFTDNCWCYLCKNPAAMELIETHFDKINPKYHPVLYGNPNALTFVQEKNIVLNSLAWEHLVINKCPAAMDLIEKHIDELTVEEKTTDNIKEEDIIKEENIRSIISQLNSNKYAFPLLEKHRHLIKSTIIKNPNIFYKKEDSELNHL